MLTTSSIPLTTEARRTRTRCYSAWVSSSIPMGSRLMPRDLTDEVKHHLYLLLERRKVAEAALKVATKYLPGNVSAVQNLYETQLELGLWCEFFPVDKKGVSRIGDAAGVRRQLEEM